MTQKFPLYEDGKDGEEVVILISWIEDEKEEPGMELHLYLDRFH